MKPTKRFKMDRATKTRLIQLSINPIRVTKELTKLMPTHPTVRDLLISAQLESEVVTNPNLRRALKEEAKEAVPATA